ncbi:glutathione S-transferase family protein [Sphingomonas sp. M1-B02]|uniref:glutathione S-transferase family protein n=1 Tax=Sphingomonas sp. M1-B02 TaxID=3114300 RepID=UPI002240770B|nr:glutathione S-transferase family protein [Sphingomonas sp. S6-11]UZK67314.1 glutathione S-transferase family protein [Sphingomonas sp. S6-11]
MITVWGGQTSRSIRVVWVLEEMGLPYRLRQVDMLAAKSDPTWLAVNPGNFLPAIQDGDVTMVESVAIMEYLMGRYGPTPLQPGPNDPSFPTYQQFLHMGEAGLATLIMVPLVSGFIAPETERDNWGARWARECVERRLLLVRRQLAGAPYMAGDRFTAADISVTYALKLGANRAGFALGDAEQAYLARTTNREAYKRAFNRSHEGMAA